MINFQDFFINYSLEIGFISSIITIFLFVWWIIWWLKKYFFREKIKIKSFWLYNEKSMDTQPYNLLFWTTLDLDKKIYEEAFPWNLLFTGYVFPKFEVLLQNNSDKTEILEDIKVKVNNIDYFIRRYVWIWFKWTEIYSFNELEDKYSGFKIDFSNLSLDPIYSLKLFSLRFYDANNRMIYSEKIDSEFDLWIWKSKTVELALDKNKLNSIVNITYHNNSETKFSKEEYPIVIPKMEIKYKYKTKKWRWFYKKWVKYMTFSKWWQHFFYNIKNWFFYKVAEIAWGWYFADDKWNFIIDTSSPKNTIGKILSIPIKRVIKTKDIDNFTFSLWVTKPALVNLELIFDFWKYKIKKWMMLDLYYPADNEYVEDFQKNAEKFKK